MTKLTDLLAEYQKDRSRIKYRRSGLRARLCDDPEIQAVRLSDEMELFSRWRKRVEDALADGSVSIIEVRKFEGDLKAASIFVQYRFISSVTEIALIVAGVTILSIIFALDPKARIELAFAAFLIILWWQVVRRLERRTSESRARAALEFVQICRGARASPRPNTRAKKTQ